MSSGKEEENPGVFGSVMKTVGDTFGHAKDAVVGKPEPPTAAEKATEAKDIVAEKAIEAKDFTVEKSKEAKAFTDVKAAEAAVKANEAKDYTTQKATEGKDLAAAKIGDFTESGKKDGPI